MTTAIKMDNWVLADRRVYQYKKKFILGALKGETGIINGVTEENKEEIFYMLMFCLCVPQSKAVKSEEAVEELRKLDFYNNYISISEVVEILTGRVRFQSTKAKRLIKAKSMFLDTDFWQELRVRYNLFLLSVGERTGYILRETRNILVYLVNGMGMKLSSHFMRNVGMGGLAILDVHIIDGLKRRGIINIDKISSSTSEYLDIEEKMKEYANEVGIALDELDLLLWSEKTGYVFK